jgi:hypothetical protein
MSGGGLVIGIVIMLAGVAYLALPFLRAGKARTASEQERERLTLIAAYERALVTVRDLDEDYQVGKLAQATYESERARWAEHGAMLLALIEQANGEKKSKQARKTVETPVPADDAVEQAIAAYVRARDQAKVQEKS